MELINKTEEAIIREEYDKAQKIVNLTNEPGWILIQEHFDNILELVREKLLIEKNPDEIVRLQEKYRAFHSMLDTVVSYASLKRAYHQQLTEIALDNEFMEKYAINE